MSLLPAIERVDNYTYGAPESGTYTLLAHDRSGALGFVVKAVAQQLEHYTKAFVVDHQAQTIRISQELNTLEKRSAALAEVASELKDKCLFETLKGWRDELYTVYHPAHQPYVLLERAFCPLLGVVMYGVHINGFIPPHISPTGEYQLWVPKRSGTKATFPGMFDNTIAGGIGHPYGVHETAIKESHEEAGIEKEYVEKNIKSAGVVTYIYQNDTEGGLIQPEVQYIYDMVFDEETRPFPVDNEAEEFFLMSLDEVKTEISKGTFKPNCALVLVDFFIRHGLITAENEAAYLEISQRCHRRIPFALK